MNSFYLHSFKEDQLLPTLENILLQNSLWQGHVYLCMHTCLRTRASVYLLVRLNLAYASHIEKMS